MKKFLILSFFFLFFFGTLNQIEAVCGPCQDISYDNCSAGILSSQVCQQCSLGVSYYGHMVCDKTDPLQSCSPPLWCVNGGTCSDNGCTGVDVSSTHNPCSNGQRCCSGCPTSPTNTPVPTQSAGCVCQSDGTCASSCPVYQSANRLSVSGIDYASPYKCTLNQTNQWLSAPTVDNKNSFCTRVLRTKGDANGTDGVDELIDFGYYFRAVIGAKLPPGVNPDFDGDGVISNDDLALWKAGKGSGVPPTATSAPQGSTSTPTRTPTPTATITPNPSHSPTPTATGTPSPTPTATLTPTPTGCPCQAGLRYRSSCNGVVNCSCNLNSALAPLEPESEYYIGDWWTQCTKPKGDANKDGVIDNQDFDKWQSNYNNQTSGDLYNDADFNHDHSVNLTDFEIWRQNAKGS